MIRVYAQTDVGQVREGNEDSFLAIDTTSEQMKALPEIREYEIDEFGLTLMVSDGMGGAAAGEIASGIAVSTVQQQFVFDTPPTDAQFIDHLVYVLQSTNKAVADHAHEHPEMRGMGATATTAAILNNKVYIGQIGDSRAYLIRQNTIQQLTRDQTFVNQLVEAGKITEEEAETHPRRNVILQALGNHTDLKIAITSTHVQDNDRLLLCSDGLSGLVRDEEMRDIILATEDIASACHQLIDMANERGGHDNITVIIAEFLDIGVIPESDDDTIHRNVIQEFSTESEPQPASAEKKPKKTRRRLFGLFVVLGVLLISALSYTMCSNSEAKKLAAISLLGDISRDYDKFSARHQDVLAMMPDAGAVWQDTASFMTIRHEAFAAMQSGQHARALALAKTSRSKFADWQSATEKQLQAFLNDQYALQAGLRKVWMSHLDSFTQMGKVFNPAIDTLSEVDKKILDSMSFEQFQQHALRRIDEDIFLSAIEYTKMRIKIKYAGTPGAAGASLMDSLQRAEKIHMLAVKKIQERNPRVVNAGFRNERDALYLLSEVNRRLSGPAVDDERAANNSPIKTQKFPARDTLRVGEPVTRKMKTAKFPARDTLRVPADTTPQGTRGTATDLHITLPCRLPP